MKKSLLGLVCVLFGLMLNAQSNKEDVAMVQAMFGKDKKALVSQYMTIPEAQKAKFWALYDEYEDKRKELGRERIALIEDYAKKYTSLDDKGATELMTKKLAWADKYTKFQQAYFPKFTAAIGGKQAAKLLQLEDYLENNIRLYIQDEIPFIDQLDKTKVEPKKQ